MAKEKVETEPVSVGVAELLGFIESTTHRRRRSSPICTAMNVWNRRLPQSHSRISAGMSSFGNRLCRSAD